VCIRYAGHSSCCCPDVQLHCLWLCPQAGTMIKGAAGSNRANLLFLGAVAVCCFFKACGHMAILWGQPPADPGMPSPTLMPLADSCGGDVRPPAAPRE
jgi:hypothetical protein